MTLQNSKVLITGANRGIGFAIAQAFAEKAAHLYLAVRKPDDKLKQSLLNKGAQSVDFLVGDLSSTPQVHELCSQIRQLDIDILINNAGLLTGGLIEEQDPKEVQNMFQVNVLASVFLTQAALPNMLKRKQGKIVNNASVSALMHFPGASTYAASKAALWAFNNSLEVELEGTGVSTLLLITPGVKTEMFDDIEKKYGSFLEVPTEHITPAEYAAQVLQAIEQNEKSLYPKGATRAGLWVNKYLPDLFKYSIKKRYHRPGTQQ